MANWSVEPRKDDSSGYARDFDRVRVFRVEGARNGSHPVKPNRSGAQDYREEHAENRKGVDPDFP